MNLPLASEARHWPDFRFYQYSLPLISPLVLKSGTLTKKLGVLVNCTKDGYSGWGDIAPLDGYSTESFADIMRLLPDVRVYLSQSRSIPATTPAMYSGLEFALAHYWSDRDSRSLYLSLNGLPERTHLQVAKLIAGVQGDDLLKHVAAAIKEGYACIKLKAGQQAVANDIHMVRSVQHLLPDGVILRIDANQSWTVSEALQFSNSIDPAGVEFIEEPLLAGEDYVTYNREQVIPFALDESLAHLKVGQLTPHSLLKCLVLKPTLLGGLQATINWLTWAESQQIKCTISSMFESGIGINGLVSLAGSKAHTSPVGLDTYSYLAEDVIQPRIQFRTGRVAIYQSFPKSWTIDFSKLEEIL